MTEPDQVKADQAKPTLRDMGDADLPWMAEVERTIFGHSAWSESLIREDWRYGTARYRAVEIAGERVGYGVYGFDGDAFHLMNLAVLPEYRGRGAARALMDDLFAEAHRLKAADVWLEVAVDNEAARALYDGYGFEVVRLRKKYYKPEGTDALVLRKELKLYTPGTPTA